MNSPFIDEVLNKAFFLACFILGDRESAIRIVEEAMARLNVTTAAQGKRLYYKPSLSPWISSKKAERYRNKVLFSEVHLLQRLIYIASEPSEKLKEESFVANAAAEEQMLIHFIKHLVRISTRRNSFYVTLAINRLLYNYTTAETMETYNAVIQDPARVKDDYYYRSRKGVLMQELKKRFGSLLDITRGLRGEERFHASGQQGRLTGLVRECLSFFTPWDTYCLVPAGVNPIIDGIAGLSSRSKEDEDKIEVDRIHAVLHPDCYTRLIKLLGFDSPERRLEAPHFFLSKDNNNGGEGSDGQRRDPSNLSDNELDEIKRHLDDQSSRRKRVAAGMLRILVDGREQARLRPSRSGSTRFEIESDAELIEVRSMVNGDDLLLASHLFTHDESAIDRDPDVTSIVLEGGQKVAITVTPTQDASQAIVDVAYRETALVRLASLYFKPQTPSSSKGESPTAARWNPLRFPAIMFGIALLLLSVFGVVRFVRNRNPSSSQTETATTDRQAGKPDEAITPAGRVNGEKPSGVADARPSSNAGIDKGEKKNPDTKRTAQSPITESARAAESYDRELSLRETRNKESVARMGANENSSATERSTRESETTRSLPKGATVVPLAEVRKVFVEVLGADVLGARVREKMIASLSASNRFSATATKGDADALLRITVVSANSATTKVSVRVALINARGEAIWHGTRSRRAFEGSIDIVAADIVKGLLDDATAQ